MLANREPQFGKDGNVTQTYEIVFDGGAKGNPGMGYGSYEITLEGEVVAHNQERYGDRITNNQAEYMTLVRALNWLADHLGDSASAASVHVFGDSQLVIRQVKGEWKIKNAGLRPRVMEVRKAMDRFSNVSLTWHSRVHSVSRLGH
jgi:ribonuclease HI